MPYNKDLTRYIGSKLGWEKDLVSRLADLLGISERKVYIGFKQEM